MLCKYCGKEVVYTGLLWIHGFSRRTTCYFLGDKVATPLLENPQLKTIEDKGTYQDHQIKTEANPKQRFGDKKVAMGAACPVADIHESMAMMEGDWKYGWRNFRDTKVEAMTYIHSALRHIQCWAEGEEVADDSGVHHLGHARACLGILLDAQENGNLIDNRKKGVFSNVLKRMEDWVAKRRKYYENKENTKQTNTSYPCTASTLPLIQHFNPNKADTFDY